MKGEPSYFVGYLPAPADVRRRAFVVGAAALMAFALLAAALGRTPLDLGASTYGDDLTIAGVYVANPYPIVAAPADARHPLGRTIMLGGEGKLGAQKFGADKDGAHVKASGVLVKRGDLDMLLIGGADNVERLTGAIPAPIATPLGRWRASGEICDGKCAAGAMRPGTGLAHKACANLCVSSGLPPVLVTTAPLEGREYLLLADHNGGPAPHEISDFMGLPVTLEGDVERLGDLMIFRVDWAKARAQ